MANQSDFERILDTLHARRSGSSWMARCPAHEDNNPSLSVAFENRRILLHCHAGCTQEAVLEKIGSITESTYDYTDERGRLLFQVVRPLNKKFKQRRPINGPGGGWIDNVKGVRRVLYRLPEVIAASIVIICEGEKDVETVRELGFTATTNAMGGGKWLPEYTEALRGKQVVLCLDNDATGKKHLELLSRELLGAVVSLKVINLPAQYKDISEWGSLTPDAFRFLVEHADEVTNEPKDWKLLYNAFEDYEEAKPLRFAIEGFLQEDAITAITGLSGHGKTFIALSITKALLNGPGMLWDYFKVKERAERVIYLAPESTLGPFKHRLILMGIYEHIANGRLLTRTASKGPTPALDDPRLLYSVKGAHVILDTAIRFVGDADDNSAAEVARGLSEDLQKILRAGARTVLVLFHAAKEARRSEYMNLENMIRGSGEMGAILATAWAVKLIDDTSTIIYVQNVKPRDFEPCGPFELKLRPSIDQTHDIQMWKKPGDVGPLHIEQPDLNPRNNKQKQELKTANLAIYKAIIEREPELTAREIVMRFAIKGIKVSESTVRGYAYDTKRQEEE